MPKSDAVDRAIREIVARYKEMTPYVVHTNEFWRKVLGPTLERLLEGKK